MFRDAAGKPYALDFAQVGCVFRTFDVGRDGRLDAQEFGVCWTKWIEKVSFRRSFSFSGPVNWYHGAVTVTEGNNDVRNDNSEMIELTFANCLCTALR